VYDDVKKALQDALAPDLQEIRGEIKALNTRVDAAEKNAELRFTMLDRSLAALEHKIDLRFDSLTKQLELDKKLETLQRRVEAGEKKEGTAA
jgi:hypothetical protein